ncbi:reverse transcriptase domain-containing protein [Tanacetum coccineum]
MQRLSGKLAALNKFLSKAAKKALPCLDTLKKCANKKDFHWTIEAEEAFQEMNKLIAELPTLTAPKKEEELMVYLSAANEAVRIVLLVERHVSQAPIHYVSRMLQGAKINYLPMEKLVLALVHAARRLRRYFQGHAIKVITEKPISQILNNREATGRLAKWGIELEAYGIRYAPRKGKSKEEQEAPEAKTYENLGTEIDIWKLYTDGASNEHGSGAGLILIDPEGADYSYALRLNFANSNNDAEYKALLAGLRIAAKIKVNAIVKETTRTWMTLIQEYIEHGILPEDAAEARMIQEKARNYTIEEGVLYRKSYLGPLLQCIGPQFRILATIITDNVTQLINDPFKSKAKGLGIQLISMSVYHSQANGVVERANRSIMHGIKTRLHQEGGAWVEELPNVLWAHRTTPKTSNGETPFSLAYGTEAVIPVKIGIPTRRTIQRFDEENEDALRMNLNLLEERRKIASIREARRKQKVERYYNQRVHHKQFKVGEFVL